MCRHDFRIKVDLSKFYNDVRQSSWIYVDKGSISCICHLEKHITKLFDVRRPFHLLLKTGEYLPPNEDARILKEGETIVVVPGTGIQSNDLNPLNVQSKVQASFSEAVPEKRKCAIDLIISSKIEAEESSEEEEDLANPLETTNENTVFLSMINDSQIETEPESKPETSLLDGSVASTADSSPLKKNRRKRVRRKKSKNATQPEESVANGADQVEYKKPKIINSVTLSNGKHIRFEESEKLEYDSSASNDSKKHDSIQKKTRVEESYWDKPTSGANLSNLLSLRQSSTPITFGRKKIEASFPQGNTETLKTKDTAVEEEALLKIQDHALTIDPKRHPLMVDKARYNDVIAFKILKMGSDYTPQFSAFIIAQTIQILGDGSTYLLKILEGKSEVQDPQGKFKIEIDETETENTETDSDLITLNWSQLIEPRLIYRK